MVDRSCNCRFAREIIVFGNHIVFHCFYYQYHFARRLQRDLNLRNQEYSWEDIVYFLITYQIVSSSDVFSSNLLSTSWSAYQARFSKIVSNIIAITQTVTLTQMFNIIKDKKNSMCFRCMFF